MFNQSKNTIISIEAINETYNLSNNNKLDTNSYRTYNTETINITFQKLYDKYLFDTIIYNNIVRYKIY